MNIEKYASGYVLKVDKIEDLITMDEHVKNHIASIADPSSLKECIYEKKKALLSGNSIDLIGYTEELALELYGLYRVTDSDYYKKQLEFYIAMLETEALLNRQILSLKQLTKITELYESALLEPKIQNNLETMNGFFYEYTLDYLKDRDSNAEFAYYYKYLLDTKEDIRKASISLSYLEGNDIQLCDSEFDTLRSRVQEMNKTKQTIEKLLMSLTRIDALANKKQDVDLYKHFNIFNEVWNFAEYYCRAIRSLVKIKKNN